MPTRRNLKQADLMFQQGLYESGNLVRKWLHNQRKAWVLDAVKKYSDSGAKLFEIGCGSCQFTKELAKDHVVVAVDINSSFIQKASNIENVSALELDITEGALSWSFDIAVCSEVIEHVPNYKSLRLLQNADDSLKTGGYLILTTPNRYSIVEICSWFLQFEAVRRIARFIYKESVDDLEHINLLTQEKLLRQLEFTNFKIIEHTNLGLYLPLVSEFGGETGLWICKKLQALMQKSKFLSGLLWTQCWVLKK